LGRRIGALNVRIKKNRNKELEIRQMLRKLRSNDESVVSDAMVDWYRYDKTPVKPLISVLKNFENPTNRECAAYGLISLLLALEVKSIFKHRVFIKSKRQKIVERFRRDIRCVILSLIETVEFDESEKVRSQALETLGMSSSAKKSGYILRKKVEKVVIQALSDNSSEVRFWACYAARQLKIEKALPKLQHLVETDNKDWGQWWYVSEEAEDAIEWIHGRHTEARIPLWKRKKKE
jgi:HEAT repeats